MERLRVSAVFLMTLLYLPTVEVNNILTCPMKLPIEFGRRSLLNCTLDDDHGDVYWFKGTATANDFPILWLENDGPGGLGYESGEYDVTPGGLLVITDPQLQHDGQYTIRVFYPGGSRKDAPIEVVVYILPEPACPTINLCQDCEGCQDIINTTGEIICSVNGARPMVDITWSVTNQSGMTSTIGQPIHHQNGGAGTWNSSVSIAYDIDRCGGFAIFQCTASSIAPLSNHVRTITVRSPETCTIPTTTSPEIVPLPIAILVPTIIGVILIILLLIGCLVYLRCRDRRRKDARYTDIPLEANEGHNETLQDPTDLVREKIEREKKKTKKDKLILGLAEFYKKFLYVKPLPWEESVLISSLYTPCECEITTVRGSTKATTSEQLFTERFSSNNKRVLITADLGYGKTTFTQHVLERWLSENDGSILIYAQLKDMERSTPLSEIVRSMLPDDIGLEQNDIDDLLGKNVCRFLLDGLGEISMTLEGREQCEEGPINCDRTERVTEALEGSPIDPKTWTETQNPEQQNLEKSRLTTECLLNGRIPNSFKYASIWVTSRDIDDSKYPFARPYARVKLTGFNSVQLNAYITRACRYYNQLRGDEADSTVVNPATMDDQLRGDEADSTVVNPATMDDQLQVDEAKSAVVNPATMDTKQPTIDDAGAKESHESEQCLFENLVKTSLDMNDIAKEFSRTPLLLIMVIHIIASKIAFPTGKTGKVNINKLTTIVRMVITVMESRYFQKLGKDSLKHDIRGLEAALGRVAFTQKMGVTLMETEEWDKLIGEEYRDLAEKIGLLHPSKDIDKGTTGMGVLAFSSYTGVEFYHQYFQELLAAQYEPVGQKEEKLFEEYLKTRTDGATLRFFQFMTGSGSKRATQILCRLAGERRMWNTLIDCLFEDENYERVKKMIGRIGKGSEKPTFENLAKALDPPVIRVTNLESKYHRTAFSSFCTMCREYNIQMDTISFQEDCAIPLLKECQLPSLERLKFYGMKVTEEKFVEIFENLSRQQEFPKQIQFVKCNTPNKLTEHSRESIESAVGDRKNEVIRREDVSLAQKFKIKSGDWGTASPLS